jgi:hypothetical protein
MARSFLLPRHALRCAWFPYPGSGNIFSREWPHRALGVRARQCFLSDNGALGEQARPPTYGCAPSRPALSMRRQDL